MSTTNHRPSRRRCTSCGNPHRSMGDQCADCVRGGDIAYIGGWFVQGGVLRPNLPERRSA